MRINPEQPERGVEKFAEEAETRELNVGVCDAIWARKDYSEQEIGSRNLRQT
jgi:hypothetical protein